MNDPENESKKSPHGKNGISESRSDEDWKEMLTEKSYHVLREHGTEQAFSGKFDHHFEDGSYLCAGCGSRLFVSDAKYDSGCGWPAFDRTAQTQAVVERQDSAHGMLRTEILCSNCGGHLGHVFPDGPTETTGLRYCVNSAALKFKGDKNR